MDSPEDHQALIVVAQVSMEIPWRTTKSPHGDSYSALLSDSKKAFQHISTNKSQDPFPRQKEQGDNPFLSIWKQPQNMKSFFL